MVGSGGNSGGYGSDESGSESHSSLRLPPGGTAERSIGPLIVRVESVAAPARSFFSRLMISATISSILLNLWLLVILAASQSPTSIPEKHLQGKEGSTNRIAVINIAGTISPPLTDKWIRQIKKAAEDQKVQGVVIAVDSPGGLVADSHQLYREIQKLVAKKPAYVAMKRLAASGGYYLAMGIGEGGKIYAEPTTWTGSIGVIIPRYNAGEMAKNIGVRVEPLVTGPLKDSLNPFRDLSQQEQDVWKAIMEDAFTRFVSVIAENRSELDEAQVRTLATGQIYTSNQAIENHLVDEIGYVDDAVVAMAEKLNISADYGAFEYQQTSGLLDSLLGTGEVQEVGAASLLLESAVPKAMYYCSWNPWVPGR